MPQATQQEGEELAPPTAASLPQQPSRASAPSRHSPVVQSPRTSSSNQKLGARGQGRTFSLSLVLSSTLGTEEASAGE